MNFDGWPSGVSDATDNTHGCHHDGTDTDVTPPQLRVSLGFPKSVSGLESHDAAPEPQPLEPLSPDHPVFVGKHVVSAKEFPLEGIQQGCKTVVVYSPVAVAGHWEADDRKSERCIFRFVKVDRNQGGAVDDDQSNRPSLL